MKISTTEDHEGEKWKGYSNQKVLPKEEILNLSLNTKRVRKEGGREAGKGGGEVPRRQGRTRRRHHTASPKVRGMRRLCALLEPGGGKDRTKREKSER